MARKITPVEDIKNPDDVKKAMRVFHVSTEILEAGNITLTENRVLDLEDERFDTVIPTIVLYAFSCELALKALGCKEGIGIVHTHDFEELLKPLSKDIKQRIKNRVLAADPTRTESFTTLLANHRTAFVNWRYFFVHGELKASIGFLRAFYKAIVAELQSE